MRRRHSFFSLRFSLQWLMHLGSGVVWGGALWLSPAPAMAVESVTVNFGITTATVHLSDLEQFAQTGEVPSRLGLYRPLLTPTVQAALQNPLSVEPAIRDRVIHDLMTSTNGQALIAQLAEVAPDLSPTTLQAALQTAAATDTGVTVLSVLRALPGERLTLNGRGLLQVIAQITLAHLEQMALSDVLRHELSPERGGGQPRSGLPQLQPSEPGRRAVEQWSVSFRDYRRDRVIPVDIYWSPRDPGPVVIFSHGFGADRYFLTYLAEHLASHGLTVISLEHPGSNVEALVQAEGSLLPAQEFVERPRDVSFVLDRLEDLNRHAFFLRRRLPLKTVTLVGHSLGGYTGLVLAGGKLDQAALSRFCSNLDFGAASPAEWFQCAATEADVPPESLADDRITQLVLMNPVAGQIFGQQGLRRVRVPTLLVAGTNDDIASVSTQQLHSFNQLSGPRSLIAVIGGTHLSVGDPDNINPALTRVPFMPERPAEETLKLRQYLNGVVLSFIMQQTQAAPTYRPFLSAGYAQAFSTPALPIRYSDRLPSRISHWLSYRERFAYRLAPPLESLASLLHLELIDVQYRVARFQREAIAQLPLRLGQLSVDISRSPHLLSQAVDSPAAPEWH